MNSYLTSYKRSITVRLDPKIHMGNEYTQYAVPVAEPLLEHREFESKSFVTLSADEHNNMYVACEHFKYPGKA